MFMSVTLTAIQGSVTSSFFKQDYTVDQAHERDNVRA